MPTTRKRRSRGNRKAVHPLILEYLLDPDASAPEGDVEGFWALNMVQYQGGRKDLAAIWSSVRDELLRKWIAENPGTRPWSWWEFDAPEPRQRIGGVGDLLSDHIDREQRYWFGIPTDWASRGLIEKGWPAASVNGKPVAWHRPAPHATPFDENDPPLFESEATYLARLGLLAPGERKRLTAEDFEPEAAACEPYEW